MILIALELKDVKCFNFSVKVGHGSWNEKLSDELQAIVKPPSYVPPCSAVSGTGGFILSA